MAPDHQRTHVTTAAGYILVFLIGMNYQLAGSLTTALVASLVILPMTITEYTRSRHLRLVGVLAILCLASAIALFAWSPETHSRGSALSILVWFGQSMLAIGALVACSKWLPLRTILVTFALGWIARILLDPTAYAANMWKYGFSQPVAIASLTIVGTRSMPVRLATSVALAAIGFSFESRSFGAICIVAFIVAEMIRRTDTSANIALSWRRTLSFGLTSIAIVWVASIALTRILTSGYFGDEIQARTLKQESGPGGLLLGGRPEWVASLALLLQRPLGYGAGAIPNSRDYDIAMQALAEAGLSTSGSYYHEYMFGDDFRLHSVAADLWLNFGLPGLAIAIVITALSTLLFVGRLGHPTAATSAVSFLTLSTLWFILFGPFYSNFPQVAFTVAVAVIVARKNSETVGMPGSSDSVRFSTTPRSS